MDDTQKRTYIVEYLVKIPVNIVTMIVNENQRRRSLMVVCTGGATMSTRPQLLSSGENGLFPGINSTGGLMQTWLNKRDNGAACTSAWYALNGAAGDTAQVIEVLEAD